MRGVWKRIDGLNHLGRCVLGLGLGYDYGYAFSVGVKSTNTALLSSQRFAG
jgi:hypothetical protein